MENVVFSNRERYVGILFDHLQKQYPTYSFRVGRNESGWHVFVELPEKDSYNNVKIMRAFCQGVLAARKEQFHVMNKESRQHKEKWMMYEKEYILPCFDLADEVGINLHALVREANGNCVIRLIKELMKWHPSKLTSPVESVDKSAK